jgi:GTP-binding protein Era
MTDREVRGRSGFVAIVGRPNAGKSTLINKLVGQKIAIVTSKPQTTRNRIQGIVTRSEGQMVFIDTPGLYDADSALGRQMMHEVAAALEDIDVLLLMVDASHPQSHMDELLLSKAKRFRGKTILVLNKVDRVAKEGLLPLIEQFSRVFEAEVIREKAIQLTYHEVPYALGVMVDKYEEKPSLLRIEVTLSVERDSQKKILIGHKGEMLKKIGTEARKELEKMLDTKIYLGLFVKVMPDWRENPARVREFDWHGQLEALSEMQRREPGDGE